MTTDPRRSHGNGPPGLAEAAQQRRERLRRVMGDLEATLASPARERFGAWQERLRTTLDGLREALESHIAETEADDGLFERTMEDAPRLAHAIERLRDQHTDLLELTDGLVQRVGQADEEQIEHLRDDGLALLGLLARHRQLGADLLFEAYFVDVGSSE